MKIKRIKFTNIVNDKLTIGELDLLKGMENFEETCSSNVCGIFSLINQNPCESSWCLNLLSTCNGTYL